MLKMANQKGGIPLDMGRLTKYNIKMIARSAIVGIMEQKPKNLKKIKIKKMKGVNLNKECFAIQCSINQGGITSAFFNRCLKATKEFCFDFGHQPSNGTFCTKHNHHRN